MLPGIGVVTLTAMLGMMLIADAVVESVLGFSVPKGAGRDWFFLSGLVSLFLGVMIIAQWPSSSIWAIGTLVGAGVLFKGITRIVASSWVRSEAHEFQRAAAGREVPRPGVRESHCRALADARARRDDEARASTPRGNEDFVMTIALWIAQGFAALVFLLTGTFKLVTPKEKLIGKMHWAATWPPGRIKLLGLVEVAGAIGLVLPAALHIAPVLTPIAAMCLALLMLGAVQTHRAPSRELRPCARAHARLRRDRGGPVSFRSMTMTIQTPSSGSKGSQ